MSTLTTRSRQNEDQLDALLEVDPSVATRSDSYVNNVEKLALNSILNPYLGERDFFEGTKSGIESVFESEDYKEKLKDSLGKENDYLSQLNEDDKLENFDLDKKFYIGKDTRSTGYEPEPLENTNELGPSYDSLGSKEHWKFEPSNETDAKQIFRSYSERKIRSELKKGAVEADLDRVKKLADEVYQE